MASMTISGLRSSLCRAAPGCGAAMSLARSYPSNYFFCSPSLHISANPTLCKQSPELSSQFLPSVASFVQLRSGYSNAVVTVNAQHRNISAVVEAERQNDAETRGGLAGSSNVPKLPTKFRMDAKTGAFQQLPMVSPAYEILGSALRKARMVRPTKGIMNVAKRERNRGAKQLDALIKELALPLKMYLQRFPRRQELHAYESALLELTLGEGKYEEVLERVDYLRKKVLDTGKNWASLCAKSTTKQEAEERLKEGFTKLEEVFNRYGQAVDDLKEHAKILRAMPVISLRTPTLCLVGAPNVGKSSLVRILSSGKPEICNYEFTTRGISIGHFEVDSRRFQVTDTPGLLERPDEERNNMEQLTLAALSHLPTSILYVHDLTGECGSSAAKQFQIYKVIKGRYSDRPWLDVVSKADLLSPPLSSSSLDSDSIDSYVAAGPNGALRVSVETGEGVDELIQRVHALLVKAHPDESKDEDSTWDKAQQDDADAKAVQEFYYPAWPTKQEN
ncbi:unnamed protein product [Calypogeia fissa]